VSRTHQTSHQRLPPCTANHKSAFTPRSNPYSNNQHSCLATAPDCTHSVLYSQIPIARHRCSCPISRGFVPWRLSDDGPAAARITHSGAVVRNPSHKRTWRRGRAWLGRSLPLRPVAYQCCAPASGSNMPVWGSRTDSNPVPIAK
jgi:hypothetical protein